MTAVLWLAWILWRIQSGWIIEMQDAVGNSQRGGFDIRIPIDLKTLTLVLLILGMLRIRRASVLALGIAESAVGFVTGALAAATEQFDLAVWVALLGAAFFVVIGYDKIEGAVAESRARKPPRGTPT